MHGEVILHGSPLPEQNSACLYLGIHAEVVLYVRAVQWYHIKNLNLSYGTALVMPSHCSPSLLHFFLLASPGCWCLLFIHKWDKRDDPRKLAQVPHLPLRLRFYGSAHQSEWARESLGKVMQKSQPFSYKITFFATKFQMSSMTQ